MRMIIVFYQDYYTEKHNKAMRYLMNNLNGATVVQDTDTATMLMITDSNAMAVIEALEDADCLYFENYADV